MSLGIARAVPCAVPLGVLLHWWVATQMARIEQQAR